MPHGSQGLFTQAGFNDPSQEDSSQTRFSVAGPGPLQSQVISNGDTFVLLYYYLCFRNVVWPVCSNLQGLMNPLYSQPFSQYNSQPLNLQGPHQQQGQSSQNQKLHYNGWAVWGLTVDGLQSLHSATWLCWCVCFSAPSAEEITHLAVLAAL